jgi:hypothetical protein
VIQQLYTQMLDEAMRGTTLKYPRPTAETPGDMTAYLYEQLTRTPRYTCQHCRGDLGEREDVFLSVVAVLGGTHLGGGVIVGGRPVGCAFGEMAPRVIGSPKWVAHCRWIYVDPAHRAGRSIKRGRRVREGVGVQLLRHLVAAALRVRPDFAVEGSFVPGSHGSRLWPRLGLLPYVTYCAFVEADGSLRDPRTLFAHRGGKLTHGDTWRSGGSRQQDKVTRLGASGSEVALPRNHAGRLPADARAVP